MVIASAVAAKDRPVTQRPALERLSQRYAEWLQSQRPQLYFDLLSATTPAQRQLNENSDIQLIQIDEFNHPFFYLLDNLNAARTISTDDVWPGGSGGLTLTGSTTAAGELGVWDGGGVRTTHQEFGGRVTQVDGPIPLHYHSTHVAGTMIAAGVSAAAKGMSFEAPLDAYDWNDDSAEMAAAAAEGLHVSSHSYGYGAGWYLNGDWYWLGNAEISETEDYGFGFYGEASEIWDDRL